MNVAAPSTVPRRRTGFGKYRTIVLSIALFLVFDLGVLILNFYTSSEISTDAVGINLAGRQRMLSQRLVKALHEFGAAPAGSTEATNALMELRNTTTLFDTTLSAFERGGETTGGDGRAVLLQPVSDARGRAAVEAALKLWQPLKTALDPALRGSDAAALHEAVRLASSSNLALLRLMNDLTTALEQVAAGKADRLRLIQTIGIGLALANFFLILFHFIRQLRDSDTRAETARRETVEILDTVTDGLFLLDRELTIGAQPSKSLHGLFGRSTLANQPFLPMLREIVSEKVYREAADFLDVLFREHVNLKLVASLNPLHEVEVLIPGPNGEPQRKYLGIEFTRVTDAHSALVHLLVTVRDITVRIELARQLELSRRQAEEQMSLLLGILHVEPPRLREFIDRADKALHDINATLRRHGSRHLSKRDEYRGVLNEIFPTIHALKGEAGLLGLEFFEKLAHDFEERIVELRGLKRVGGDELIGLAVQLDRLIGSVEAVRAMVERLGSLQQGFAQEATAAAGAPAGAAAETPAMAPTGTAAPLPELTVDTFRFLVERLAQTEHKRVQLLASGLDTLAVSGAEQITALREVLVQLLRNAVAHGIETPEERHLAGKTDVGTIRLQARADASAGIELICHDDGRGLDPGRIRAAALQSGRWSEDELDAMGTAGLRALLFEPGFTTAAEATLAAGRGVGMDVIKHRVEALGGTLSVASEPGRYCAWRITLPGLPGLGELSFETT